MNGVKDVIKIPVGNEVKCRVDIRALKWLTDQIWNQVWGQVWDQVADPIRYQVGRQVYEDAK